MNGDPEKPNNWTAQIRKAQLWLQQRLGLSVSLVAGVMLGSQIDEVAKPEAATVEPAWDSRWRARRSPAAPPPPDRTSLRHAFRSAPLDAGPVTTKKDRNWIGSFRSNVTAEGQPAESRSLAASPAGYPSQRPASAVLSGFLTEKAGA